LARLIATYVSAEFVPFSAVSGGVKEARAAIEAARERLKIFKRRTLLFVDEIHRFNKSQQDTLLPAVEDGTVALLGATTENPSFEINSALISRARVFVLKPLDESDLIKLIDRALRDKDVGLGFENIEISDDSKRLLCQLSGGDARSLLNNLELVVSACPLTEGKKVLSKDQILESLQKNTILYDVSGEEHYNLISALHKSVRASDPQAALYYLARMIEGGEDPVFIARRLVRMASEDIGLADPQALPQSLAALQAVELLGYPECDTALAQAAIYLATAPKSHSLYTAIKAAKAEVKESGALPIPLHFRNAVTSLMKELDYGKGYQYDQDWPEKVSPQKTLPEQIEKLKLYEPGRFGFEKEIQKRMEYFEEIRRRLRGESP